MGAGVGHYALVGRLKKVRALAALASATWIVAGCSSTACNSVGHFALVVQVQDATGTQVCDAAVTVTDGDYSVELPTPTPSQACTYFGPGEREGVYTIAATRAGATGRVAGVAVTRRGECRVLGTEQVTVRLDPS